MAAAMELDAGNAGTAAGAEAAEAPAADPMTGGLRWEIKEFASVANAHQKYYSENFFAGGFQWRVLVFPRGNNQDFLSVYLDAADSDTQPYGWTRNASFSLVVVSQGGKGKDVKKESQHQFQARESDWGFTQFMALSDLHDPEQGYLVNDTLVIQCDVKVNKDSFLGYDSKKETGFVGLKNQGATCYLNSLLQTLFHVRYFRKAVYHMPTAESEEASKSIPLALQSLFYKMQHSEQSVATKELTMSFGWDSYESFMQHDAQELNRVLCEKLEEKMKGTVVENTIAKLFEGSVVNYIQCINITYKSERKETFMDLQLDVKGCKDVYASFDKYIEVERLDGDNKYEAGDNGLQDAKKGVLFEKLPPVLELQLKRFEYDFQRDTMVKINDRYEFPEELDLDVEDGKYFSPSADRNVRNLYRLHSVLVHSGGVHGGHYYAYIRPEVAGDDWLKFDDERVTKESAKKAIDEQFGGSDDDARTDNNLTRLTPPTHGFRLNKHSNAYMLVYVRESDKDEMLCHVDKSDILPHVRERLQREQAEKEKRRKEKQEAHLYTIIKVATDRDIKEQIGTGFDDGLGAPNNGAAKMSTEAAQGGGDSAGADTGSPGSPPQPASPPAPAAPATHTNSYFDLVDHERVRHFRVQKQMVFHDFKLLVEKELAIPVESQRYWMWAKRQNHSYRPSRPLTHEEENAVVLNIREGLPASRGDKTASSDLKLFLETPSIMFSGSLHKNLPPPMHKGLHTIVIDSDGKPLENLLFFKLYDPRTELFTYVGRAFARKDRPISELLPAMCAFAGYEPGTPLDLYEEIKFEPQVMIETVSAASTLNDAQLEDGDIICFQRAGEPGGGEVEMRDASGGMANAVVDAGAARGGGPRYPTVEKFLQYVRNRQIVRFVPLDSATQRSNGIGIQDASTDANPGLCLELSKNSTYDDVTAALAHRLGVADPTWIRLTAHNTYSNTAKPNPIKYRGVDKLVDMLTSFQQMSDQLYYEVLDMPLSLLEQLKTLRISYHDSKTAETSTHSVRLNKDATVADALAELKKQLTAGVGTPGAGAPKVKKEQKPSADAAAAAAPAPAPAPAAGAGAGAKPATPSIPPVAVDRPLRLLEVFYSKIYKIFDPTEKIEGINDQYWMLQAEQVPAEEAAVVANGGMVIHVYHLGTNAAAAVSATGDAAAGGGAAPAAPAVPATPDPSVPQSRPGPFHNFGDPFLLAISPGETAAQVKSRIQRRLGLDDAAFAKYSLVFVSVSKGEYVRDDEVLMSRFEGKRDYPQPWEVHLALEHEDKMPGRRHAHGGGGRVFSHEKAIKIN